MTSRETFVEMEEKRPVKNSFTTVLEKLPEIEEISQTPTAGISATIIIPRPTLSIQNASEEELTEDSIFSPSSHYSLAR